MWVVRAPVYFEMRYIQMEIRGTCDELLWVFPSRFVFRTKMTPKATKEIGTTRSEMLEMIQKYPKMKRSWFSPLVPRFLLKMRSQGLEEKWWWLATGLDFWWFDENTMNSLGIHSDSMLSNRLLLQNWKKKDDWKDWVRKQLVLIFTSREIDSSSGKEKVDHFFRQDFSHQIFIYRYQRHILLKLKPPT